MLVIIALIMAQTSFAHADAGGTNRDASPSQLEMVAEKYLSQLNDWIERGGDLQTVREEVLAPCSKLVIVAAKPHERAAFMAREDMETYDARAGFCMQAVVNTVHPVEAFSDRAWVGRACADPALLMQAVCWEFLGQHY